LSKCTKTIKLGCPSVQKEEYKKIKFDPGGHKQKEIKNNNIYTILQSPDIEQQETTTITNTEHYVATPSTTTTNTPPTIPKRIPDNNKLRFNKEPPIKYLYRTWMARGDYIKKNAINLETMPPLTITADEVQQQLRKVPIKSSFKINRNKNENEEDLIRYELLTSPGHEEDEWDFPTAVPPAMKEDDSTIFGYRSLLSQGLANNNKITTQHLEEKYDDTYTISSASTGPSKGKLFFTPGTINGNKVVCLVDCGATNNFISSTFIDKLKQTNQITNEITPTNRKVKGYNGVITPAAGLFTTKLKLDHQINLNENELENEPNQTFIITQLHNEDIILGMPWLAEMDAKLSFTTRSIKIRTGNMWTQLPLLNEPSTVDDNNNNNTIVNCVMELYDRTRRIRSNEKEYDQ
jgi:hypothetical protein